MTWARIDDTAWNNEKLMALSPEAKCLDMLSWSFAASEWPAGRGLISLTRALALARAHGLSDPSAAVDELLERGRWRRRGRMLEIHDLDKYMPASDLSAKRAAAGRMGGIASATNKQGPAIAQAKHQQLLSKTPAIASARDSRVPLPVDISPPVVPPRPRSQEQAQVDAFTEAWNANCDPLPRLKKPPESVDNRRLALRAVRYFDGDLDALARAIKRCAADRDYREHRYGFASFCRHVEDRWGAEPRAVSEAPILHLSADERAKRRQAVSAAVRERLRAGAIPRPEEFAPEDRGYLDEALAENSWLIEQLRWQSVAVQA